MSTEKDVPATSALPTLLIFGAGGHGRVVADAALASQDPAAPRWARVVASDRDDAVCQGELLRGIPLMRVDAARTLLATQGVSVQLHVAIGHNPHRQAEALLLGADQLVALAHPLASVSPNADLAQGCFVAAQAVVAPGAKLAEGVIVNHGAVVDHDCRVGAYAHIGPNATLGGDVSVGTGALVGAGATVLPGLSVGGGVVVGAGAVLTNDAMEGTWVGVPARRVR